MVRTHCLPWRLAKGSSPNMTPVQTRVSARPHSVLQQSETLPLNPPPGAFLAFVERHETLVQLLPFIFAVTLILLSLISPDFAGIIQRLDVTKTK